MESVIQFMLAFANNANMNMSENRLLSKRANKFLQATYNTAAILAVEEHLSTCGVSYAFFFQDSSRK